MSPKTVAPAKQVQTQEHPVPSKTVPPAAAVKTPGHPAPSKTEASSKNTAQETNLQEEHSTAQETNLQEEQCGREHCVGLRLTKDDTAKIVQGFEDDAEFDMDKWNECVGDEPEDPLLEWMRKTGKFTDVVDKVQDLHHNTNTLHSAEVETLPMTSGIEQHKKKQYENSFEAFYASHYMKGMRQKIAMLKEVKDHPQLKMKEALQIFEERPQLFDAMIGELIRAEVRVDVPQFVGTTEDFEGECDDFEGLESIMRKLDDSVVGVANKGKAELDDFLHCFQEFIVSLSHDLQVLHFDDLEEEIRTASERHHWGCNGKDADCNAASGLWLKLETKVHDAYNPHVHIPKDLADTIVMQFPHLRKESEKPAHGSTILSAEKQAVQPKNSNIQTGTEKIEEPAKLNDSTHFVQGTTPFLSPEKQATQPKFPEKTHPAELKTPSNSPTSSPTSKTGAPLNLQAEHSTAQETNLQAVQSTAQETNLQAVQSTAQETNLQEEQCTAETKCVGLRLTKDDTAKILKSFGNDVEFDLGQLFWTNQTFQSHPSPLLEWMRKTGKFMDVVDKVQVSPHHQPKNNGIEQHKKKQYENSFKAFYASHYMKGMRQKIAMLKEMIDHPQLKMKEALQIFEERPQLFGADIETYISAEVDVPQFVGTTELFEGLESIMRELDEIEDSVVGVANKGKAELDDFLHCFQEFISSLSGDLQKLHFMDLEREISQGCNGYVQDVANCNAASGLWLKLETKVHDAYNPHVHIPEDLANTIVRRFPDLQKKIEQPANDSTILSPEKQAAQPKNSKIQTGTEKIEQPANDSTHFVQGTTPLLSSQTQISPLLSSQTQTRPHAANSKSSSFLSVTKLPAHHVSHSPQLLYHGAIPYASFALMISVLFFLMLGVNRNFKRRN